jgi:peptidoglycan/xylan/chitin deacetylase (PgdA/CDA1 family)
VTPDLRYNTAVAAVCRREEQRAQMRRFVYVIAAFLIAMGLLAGCGGSSAAQPVNKTAAQVPILMYHHIAAPPDSHNERESRLAVPPAQLEEELAYFQRAGYTTITLDELTAALSDGAALPDKPVILTFDDGYIDFYTNAYPLLKRYNDKATIYIISGRVGKPGYLTWDELHELAASPLITIGAHTRTHPQLAKKSPQRVRDELDGCKADLESRLSVVVRHLAYPSGSYNKDTIKQAQASGYVTAATVHFGIRERADKLLELPRVFVDGGEMLNDLIAELDGRRTKENPAE